MSDEFKNENQVKQSVGDKIAEKVVEGYKKVEDFAKGGYKDTGKNFKSGFDTVKNTVVDSCKKASDFCIEKVFSREGESLDETKARIKRGEFGVNTVDETEKTTAEEVIIEDDSNIIVNEEEKKDLF